MYTLLVIWYDVFMRMYIYIYIHVWYNGYMYIYIYIQRERERDLKDERKAFRLDWTKAMIRYSWGFSIGPQGFQKVFYVFIRSNMWCHYEKYFFGVNHRKISEENLESQTRPSSDHQRHGEDWNSNVWKGSTNTN